MVPLPPGRRGRREVTLNIANCGMPLTRTAAGYQACMSLDREDWGASGTSYADGVLTIRFTPETDWCGGLFRALFDGAAP